jgi:hypothetical protein
VSDLLFWYFGIMVAKNFFDLQLCLVKYLIFHYVNRIVSAGENLVLLVISILFSKS